MHVRDKIYSTITACLALAKEPLSVKEIVELLYQNDNLHSNDETGTDFVKQTLAAMSSSVSPVTTPEGVSAYFLYDYSQAKGIDESSSDHNTVDAFRKLFTELASKIPVGPLAPYLFRQGISHLLEAGRATSAVKLLTNFDYLIERLKALNIPDAVDAIHDDWRAVIFKSGHLDQENLIWEAFWRERLHILRRGDGNWPAHKILLQLAIEHADDSPITIQAEKWLEQGNCDWVWMRNPQRKAHLVPDPCLLTFEGHTGSVNGAQFLSDGRILSWSYDHTLRLWNAQTGQLLTTLVGHADSVTGVQFLPDGRILSWSGGYKSNHHAIWLWNNKSGEPLAVLSGHTDTVTEVQVLADGSILSSSKDSSLRHWDGKTGKLLDVKFTGKSYCDRTSESANNEQYNLHWSNKTDDYRLHLYDRLTGKQLAEFKGHTDKVNGAKILSDGRILSFSDDTTLRLWEGATGKLLAILVGHSGSVSGVELIPDDRILSWSTDGSLKIWKINPSSPSLEVAKKSGWLSVVHLTNGGHIFSSGNDHIIRYFDGETGEQLGVISGHTDQIRGSILLPHGRILSWSKDNTLRLWDCNTQEQLAVLTGHNDVVVGAQLLPDGRILSWSRDHTLRLWNKDTYEQLTVMTGHTGWIGGVQYLSDGRILSWSQDKTIRLWDGESGKLLSILKGHYRTVINARMLPDGRILSRSWDNSICLWDGLSGVLLTMLLGHTDACMEAQLLSNGHILSRSLDNTLRLWDSQSGEFIAEIKGHTQNVSGAIEISGGRIVSWSGDLTLRFWDSQTGKSLGAPVFRKKLPWLNPQLIKEITLSKWPKLINSYSVGWSSFMGTVYIASIKEGISPVCWQCGSLLRPEALLSSGNLIASTGTGDILSLQLFHGGQRIDLKEYEAEI